MRYLGFQPASFNFGTPEEIIGFFSSLGYLCHTAVMSETKLSIRCESRLRPELLDVMRTSNHFKCRMSQICVAQCPEVKKTGMEQSPCLFFIPQLVVRLSLKRTNGILIIFPFRSDDRFLGIRVGVKSERFWLSKTVCCRVIRQHRCSRSCLPSHRPSVAGCRVRACAWRCCCQSSMLR